MTLTQAAGLAERSLSGVLSKLGLRHGTPPDLVIVAAAALALRLPAVGFGLPAMLHPDEPLNISIGARMAADGDWDPHLFAYPSLLYDVEALAERAARLLTGHMLMPGGIVSQGMGINRTPDPHIVLALRLITVALSVGICLLVYGAIRRVTGRRWAGVGCGLMAATSPLLITNGVFITPDTYSAFFTAATLVGALAVLRRGSRLDYVLAGVAVGFTAGSKYDAVAALPVVVAHVLREGRAALRPHSLKLIAMVAVTAAAAFALSTPAVLFDTGSMVNGLSKELTHYSTGHSGSQGDALGFYLSTLMHDQAALLPGAALALVAASFGRFRKEVIVVGAFAVAFLALISSQTVRFDRDLLPLLPALILLTGFAAAWIGELVVGHWSGLPRPAGPALVAAAGAAVLIPAVFGALGVPQTLDEAPRTEAAAWLKAHVPEGSSVVVEHYGPWITAGTYKVTEVDYVAVMRQPVDARAIIVTDEASGRFIDDAKDYPVESGNYRKLLTRYCVAAKFTDGPWVEVLTPCR